MRFRDKTVLFIATGFFSGRLPVAPGTAGSLVGLPLCFIVSRFDLWFSTILVLTILLSGIWISDQAEYLLDQKDPGCIVIDEIIGMMVSLWNLEFNLFTIITGFFLFRFFDILKPFPIRYVEKRLKGGDGYSGG